MKKWMIIVATFMASLALAEEFEMTGTLMGTTYLRVEGEKRVTLGSSADLSGQLGSLQPGDQVRVKVDGSWHPNNSHVFITETVLSITAAQ